MADEPIFRVLKDGTILHHPKNNLDRIDSVWVFISSDATGEGVVAMPMRDGTSMPLVAADEKRLKSLRPMAEALAKRANIKIKLIRLTQREEVEEFGP